MSPKGRWLRMLLAECPSSRCHGRGRSQGVEGHACKPPGQSQTCGLCCHLHPGMRGVGSWPLPRGPHLHPLAPGLGVRTWISRPFSASRVAILGAFAWLLMRWCPVEEPATSSTCPGPHASCPCPSPPLPAQMVSARLAQLPPSRLSSS